MRDFIHLFLFFTINLIQFFHLNFLLIKNIQNGEYKAV